MACLGQGAGHEVWFIQTEPLGFGWIDTETFRIEHLPETKAGAFTLPRAMTLGPDGHMWFTDPDGCRIGRVTRQGEVTAYDLGKGQHPEELVASREGWLFFTLRGQPVIGSIRAVAARTEDARGAFVEKAPVVATAGSGPRRPSGTERRKRQQARRASMPAPAAAPSEPLETKNPLAASLVSQPPATAARRASELLLSRTPRERLEAMHLHAEDKDLAHILKRHGAGSKAGASTFARIHDRDSLLSILARSLVNVEIGRELRTDRQGRFYTYVTSPGVGVTGSGPTDRFCMVTTMRRNPGTRAWEHLLVTAYPD